MEIDLIPPGTTITSKTESPAHDVSGSGTRTFLCTLVVTQQKDQESIDVSVWGSADGSDWGPMPLLKMPQQFYRGATKQVLDLVHRPEVRFLRALCEVHRWGRGAPEPEFAVAFKLLEVPAFSSAAPAAHC